MFDAESARNMALDAIYNKYKNKIEEIEKEICTAACNGEMYVCKIKFDTIEEKNNIALYLKAKCGYTILTLSSESLFMASISWYGYEEPIYKEI